MTHWRGVRYRPDVGWEMRCDMCAAAGGQSYWPLDFEWWDPDRGLSRCRGCWNARLRQRRHVETFDEQRAARRRTYKREWMARRREKQREAERLAPYERRKAA